MRRSSVLCAAAAVAAAAEAAAAAGAGGDTYDYIVVGAGSAGSPLAARLAKAGRSVLLIESGPDDDWKGVTQDGRVIDPLIPNNCRDMLYDEYVDDFVASEPIWQVDHGYPPYPAFSNLPQPKRQLFMPRARIVGGCSMHNNMINLRPSPEIYDAWGEGWEWDTLLPKFKAMEHCLQPGVDPAYHGSDGEVYVSSLLEYCPEADHALLAAARKAGAAGLFPGGRTYAPNGDFNGATRLGAGAWPTSTVNGTRWSSSRAFLTPEVRALPNFKLLTEATVHRVLFNGTQAIGVSYQREGEYLNATVRREVILSAGTFRSPQLLMLSGVGPLDVLSDYGIPAVAESYGVGKNLQDHGMPYAEYEVTKPGASYDDKPDPRYNYAPIGGFYYSSWCLKQNCSYPDMQFECGGGFVLGSYASATNRSTEYCVISLSGHVQSSPGSLTLKSVDPSVYPRITPNYLGARADVSRMVESFDVVDMIFRQDPEMFGERIFPNKTWTSRARLEEAVQMSTNTNYHPVGTCKMGPRSDEHAVVDQQLKVHGVRGLRVADASIMPLITNVNTDMPTRLIGYHAADLILAEG